MVKTKYEYLAFCAYFIDYNIIENNLKLYDIKE